MCQTPQQTAVMNPSHLDWDKDGGTRLFLWSCIQIQTRNHSPAIHASLRRDRIIRRGARGKNLPPLCETDWVSPYGAQNAWPKYSAYKEVMKNLLSKSKVGTGRRVKQEQEEIFLQPYTSPICGPSKAEWMWMLAALSLVHDFGLLASNFCMDVRSSAWLKNLRLLGPARAR